MSFLWRIIAKHEDFVGRIGNQEEISALATVVEIFAHAFDDGAWSMARDHELVVLAVATFLKRKHKIFMHFFLSENTLSQRKIVFETTRVEIGQAKNTRTASRSALFVFATLSLDFLFDDSAIIITLMVI